MKPTCSEAFPVSDIEDFASHLGLDGTDADMFYEVYFGLNCNDEWTCDEDEDN